MIAVIDYGLGNLASVKNALTKIGISSEVSSDINVLKKAKALILPGVGAAGQGMKNLKEKGLDTFITEQIRQGKPFLGICLGMQLLFEKSEEGNVTCLGILKGSVKKFKKMRKVPQIGWNQIQMQKLKFKNQNFFKKIPDSSYFYFINSYYCSPSDQLTVVETTRYGEDFASVIVKNNIVGVQFHPEKSGDVGLQLLKNFWEAVC